MSCVPAWSTYTLPGRGKLVLLPFDLVDLLDDELKISDGRQSLQNVTHRAPRDFRALGNCLEDTPYWDDIYYPATDTDSLVLGRCTLKWTFGLEGWDNVSFFVGSTEKLRKDFD